MMCLRTFTNKTKEDFNDWKGWVDFVNENYQYAKAKSSKWDFLFCCKSSELPSYHPYWTFAVEQSAMLNLDREKKKYKECLENPDRIKYLYNITTKLEDIAENIKNKESTITNYSEAENIVNSVIMKFVT